MDVVRTSIVSVALVCLVVLALFAGLSSATVVIADNSRPYCIEPKDPCRSPEPYSIDAGSVVWQPNIVSEPE